MDEKTFDPRALERLEAHAWPGNVRELRNVVESLILTVPDEVIQLGDLPSEFRVSAASREQGPYGESSSAGILLSGLARSEFEHIRQALKETGGNATQAAKQLGIAKSTLYLKLKKYSLDESLDSWRTLSPDPT